MSENFHGSQIPFSLDELFQYAESQGHGDLHIKIDHETGLRAIVAIHNTNLGPALGGCRFIEYHNSNEAIYDALRLARGMSYKAAISNLPLGGGKSVIMRPKVIKDREALFEKFGEFVNELGGRYITAVDSGSTVADMDAIHRKTQYVTSTSRAEGHHGDPSYSTAVGVVKGMEAVAKLRLGRDDLQGIKVAIQGTGHVGYYVAELLNQAGAKLTVCDMNAESAKRCADSFNAKLTDPSHIYDADCDIFAPCALGAVLNNDTIPRLKAKIIAGSANNQLLDLSHGQQLRQQGILYAPDYVINAGGLIEVVGVFQHKTEAEIRKQVEDIYHTVYQICERALHEDRDPAEVADNIAAARIYGENKIS